MLIDKNAKKDYISASQISMYHTCKHQYYLNYISGTLKFTGNIFTVFGTAMHETLQAYLKMLFDISVSSADSLDLESMLQENMIKEYKVAREQNDGKDICTLDQIKDFYVDGVEILKYFKKKRNKYFSTRQYKLLGIETEVNTPINKVVKFKGFLDIVLQDKHTNRVKIIDIKTSYGGWRDKKKKDPKTRMQLLFYKQFYSEQFNIPIDEIDIEFFIVKRKVSTAYDWPIPRIQVFVPPSSKRTIATYTNIITEMIADVFDEKGNRVDKVYPTNKSADNCKWCAFKGTDKCDA